MDIWRVEGLGWLEGGWQVAMKVLSIDWLCDAIAKINLLNCVLACRAFLATVLATPGSKRGGAFLKHGAPQ